MKHRAGGRHELPAVGDWVSVRFDPKATVSPTSMPSSVNDRSNQASPVAGGAGTRSFGAS